MIQDPRIWTPDETCSPFLFMPLAFKQAAVGYINVPNGHALVIAFLRAIVSDSDGALSFRTFHFVRGRFQATGATSARNRHESLSGGIIETERFSFDGQVGVTETFAIGIAQGYKTSGGQPHKVLTAGQWSVTYVNGFGSEDAGITLSGWSFPLERAA